MDGDKEGDVLIFKQVGKVAALRQKVAEQKDLDVSKVFISHCGMAHTRWGKN